MQIVLPMAEKVGWLRKGVSELVRETGHATDSVADGRRSEPVRWLVTLPLWAPRRRSAEKKLPEIAYG
jgi:hypothetical protein